MRVGIKVARLHEGYLGSHDSSQVPACRIKSTLSQEYCIPRKLSQPICTTTTDTQKLARDRVARFASNKGEGARAGCAEELQLCAKLSEALKVWLTGIPLMGYPILIR